MISTSSSLESETGWGVGELASNHISDMHNIPVDLDLKVVVFALVLLFGGEAATKPN